jgi:hypothetical protein
MIRVRRDRRTQLAVGLATIAAVAIAAPAIGEQGATIAASKKKIAVSKKKVKKLIRKEVSRQLAKATGPAGPPGANGLNGGNGANGAPGSARAYVRVTPHGGGTPCTGGPSGTECAFGRAKGVSRVTREGQGRYCVTAPRISPDTTPAAATVDTTGTNLPTGNASATIDSTGCGGGFEVFTYHQAATAVRNAADNGTEFVAGNAASSDFVAFTVVIP